MESILDDYRREKMSSSAESVQSFKKENVTFAAVGPFGLLPCCTWGMTSQVISHDVADVMRNNCLFTFQFATDVRALWAFSTGK